MEDLNKLSKSTVADTGIEINKTEKKKNKGYLKQKSAQIQLIFFKKLVVLICLINAIVIWQ